MLENVRKSILEILPWLCYIERKERHLLEQMPFKRIVFKMLSGLILCHSIYQKNAFTYANVFSNKSPGSFSTNWIFLLSTSKHFICSINITPVVFVLSFNEYAMEISNPHFLGYLIIIIGYYKKCRQSLRTLNLSKSTFFIHYIILYRFPYNYKC